MTRKDCGKVLITAMALALLPGCASITHDSSQRIRLETRLPDGGAAEGADCALQSDGKRYELKTPGTVVVARSGSNLEITCRHPSFPEAKATAVSRANAGMYGNILLGGAIGAIIDHSSGKAYNYPTWLQLVMGKILWFDRSDETDGLPSVARVTGTISEEPAIFDQKVTMDDLKDLMTTAR